MQSLLVILHCGTEHEPLFRAIVSANWTVHAHVEPGAALSEGWRALARRLRGAAVNRRRILPGLLEHLGLAPRGEWDRLVIASWSAAYALLEELLAVPANRDVVDGWVALDSGYGTADASVIDFARLARDGRRIYYAGHTDVPTYGAYADSGQFLAQVQREAGGAAGLFQVEHWVAAPAALAAARGRAAAALAARREGRVYRHEDLDAEGAFWRAEHVAALTVHGPPLVARAVAALEGRAVPSRPPTSSTAISSPRTLRSGHHGDDVADLQRSLTALGHTPGPIDGAFGSRTRAAVIAFQGQHAGLQVDGVAGPRTLAALAAAIAVRGEPLPERIGPLGERALAVAIGELGQHELPGPETNPRISEYHAGARRRGHPLGLVGDEPPWCAVFVGWCDAQAATDGEPVPPWRAAVWEIWADAAPAATARAKTYRPRRGDLAVFRRGGQDPRSGGKGHVVRIEQVDAETFVAIGGNEGGLARFGGEVMRTEYRFDDPELGGFVVRS